MKKPIGNSPRACRCGALMRLRYPGDDPESGPRVWTCPNRCEQHIPFRQMYHDCLFDVEWDNTYGIQTQDGDVEASRFQKQFPKVAAAYWAIRCYVVQIFNLHL